MSNGDRQVFATRSGTLIDGGIPNWQRTSEKQNSDAEDIS